MEVKYNKIAGFHCADCVTDLFVSAIDICRSGNFDEELPPLIVPDNLNAAFTVPDKVDAIRQHTSRFNVV